MKYTPHVWTTLRNKYLAYLKCQYCGLVRLKNQRTIQAIKLGCVKD